MKQTFPTTTRMTAFVTGASGFVGAHLVRHLAHTGQKVYAFVRPTSAFTALQKLPVELVSGDIRDKAALAQIFHRHPEIDTVFHLASIVTPVAVSDSVYSEINLQGTQNILQVCRDARLKAFVHCSSVGVIGPLPEIPANEQTRCAPDSNYGVSKYQAERLALASQQQFHLPVAVVRPAWVYGPGDRRTFKFFRMVAKGRFFLIGDGQTKLHPVYVDDVVRGLILCAERIDKAQGEVFIVAGAQSVTLANLAAVIAQAAGSALLPFKVPAGLAKFGATVCEALWKPLGLEPPIHHRRLDFYFRDQAFDIAKIRDILGFEPQVDVPTGVKQAVNWYQEQGWLA